MSTRVLPPAPQTYAQLRDAVIAVVVQGRQAIDRAWLDTYHETGRLINEHVLLFRERANYGAGVYEKLATDTGISKRTLQECAQFHRYFPIARQVAQLGWNCCRLICQVDDESRRTALVAEAVKNNWSSGEIVEQVRAINALAAAAGANGDAAVPAAELLTPRRGTPGLHPIVDRGSGPEVDLGFKFYRALGPTAKLTTKDIVRLDPSTSLRAGGVRKVDRATKDQLFTYAATVRKVVDGDTLTVALAVAPGFTHELKLRLRGLDCPEMSTAAGRAAKAFVDNLVRAGDEVIISTAKPDKYDRYLADVFVRQSRARSFESRDRAPASQLESSSQLLAASKRSEDGSPFNFQPAANGSVLFLNNALLESGHAVRYDGGAKEE
jgi:micrococcal nuclease